MASSGTRYQARTSIAQYFGGTTLQSVVDGNGPYIEGPLQSSGLSAVYPRWAKRIPDSNYFLFSNLMAYATTPRGMGAIMVVHLPRIKERRIAVPAYNVANQANGTKQDRMMVELHVYHLGQQDYPDPCEEDLEQLLDAIYTQIETDVTLGGVVYGAGETAYGIQSLMNPPVCLDKPERIEQYAKISFECDFFFNA
jgi:hypothetical protein